MIDALVPVLGWCGVAYAVVRIAEWAWNVLSEPWRGRREEVR